MQTTKLNVEVLLCMHDSEEQGFGNPCGYTGKGLEGRGQGMECLTPHKPLPMTEGNGIPSLLLAGKSSDVCGHLPYHKHVINKQMFPFSTTTFIATHCVTTFANHHYFWQPSFNHPPPPLDDDSVAMPHYGSIHTPFQMTWHVNGHATLSRW